MVNIRLATIQEILSKVMLGRAMQISLMIGFTFFCLAYLMTWNIRIGVMACIFLIAYSDVCVMTAIHSIRLEMRSKEMVIIQNQG